MFYVSVNQTDGRLKMAELLWSKTGERAASVGASSCFLDEDCVFQRIPRCVLEKQHM